MKLTCARCGESHFPKQSWQHVNCAVVARDEVNTVVSEDAPAVNKNPKKKRGAYPGTDSRREYMRQLMAARRAAKPQGGA